MHKLNRSTWKAEAKKEGEDDALVHWHEWATISANPDSSNYLYGEGHVCDTLLLGHKAEES